jgi:hypothetical protein
MDANKQILPTGPPEAPFTLMVFVQGKRGFFIY